MIGLPDTTSPRVLHELFQRYGLQPSRQLGQNFLIDANIVRKITAAAEIKAGDAVFEVGPGAGALTISLVKTGAEVLAIEIDRGLTLLLKDLFIDYPSVTIVNRDVLKISWNDLIAAHFKSNKAIKLVSNLPYLISSPFMYALFREYFPFERAILMFQEEVARRLVASPGDSDYSGLSVISSYYTDRKLLFKISSNVFWPRPGVESAVVELTPRKRILNRQEEKHFSLLVQGVFQQRRKTIFNNMARLFPPCRDLLKSALEKASIDPASRPEELTAEQFAKLARITYNYGN